MRWPAATSAWFSARAGRGLRLAVCGLLAAAQLLVFSHGARGGHRTCALHGESVHIQLTRSSFATPSLPGPMARPTFSDGDHHEHEHCLSMGQTRERLLPSSTTELARRCLVTTHDQPAVTAHHPVVVALWSLAPKNSPPA